ncbi:MAG: DegV family protein [Clostridia bacterium]|nr:DegV family protein [Clostridia bacterium]
MKTAIITDSNAGITQADGKELGICVVPVPVLIEGEQFMEDISLTQEQFYEKLKDIKIDVATSQPSIPDVAEYWDKALEDNDAVIYIHMSSALSASYGTLANYVAEEPRYQGKVFVVDNQRISLTQKQSAIDAKKMADEGMPAQEIYEWLTETKMTSSIYLMVDTLKYLKKGGRITPAVALIGTILKLKPVLQIQGGKLDTYSKSARKISQAKEIMINAVKADLESRFSKERAEGRLMLSVAYTDNYDTAEEFRKELEAAFPDIPYLYTDHLSLAVAVHTGPGAFGVVICITR